MPKPHRWRVQITDANGTRTIDVEAAKNWQANLEVLRLSEIQESEDAGYAIRIDRVSE